MIAALLLHNMIAKRRINPEKQVKSVQKLNSNAPESVCCRTCLGTDDLVWIFCSSDVEKMSYNLRLVTGLKIRRNDGLSQKICNKCLEAVHFSLYFRLKCKQAEDTLLGVSPMPDTKNELFKVTLQYPLFKIEIANKDFKNTVTEKDDVNMGFLNQPALDDQSIEEDKSVDETCDENEDILKVINNPDITVKKVPIQSDKNILSMKEFEGDNTRHDGDENLSPNDDDRFQTDFSSPSINEQISTLIGVINELSNKKSNVKKPINKCFSAHLQEEKPQGIRFIKFHENRDKLIEPTRDSKEANRHSKTDNNINAEIDIEANSHNGTEKHIEQDRQKVNSTFIKLKNIPNLNRDNEADISIGAHIKTLLQKDKKCKIIRFKTFPKHSNKVVNNLKQRDINLRIIPVKKLVANTNKANRLIIEAERLGYINMDEIDNVELNIGRKRHIEENVNKANLHIEGNKMLVEKIESNLIRVKNLPENWDKKPKIHIKANEILFKNVKPTHIRVKNLPKNWDKNIMCASFKFDKVRLNNIDQPSGKSSEPSKHNIETKQHKTLERCKDKNKQIDLDSHKESDVDIEIEHIEDDKLMEGDRHKKEDMQTKANLPHQKPTIVRVKNFPPDWDKMKRSENRTLPDGTQVYICKTCGKKFTRRNSYKHHERLHTHFHVCEFCGKSKKNMFTLRAHLQAQHGFRKMFKCSLCEYSSARQESLNIHERRHRNERPYVCDRCAAAFYTRGALVQHIGIHMSPHIQCPFCPKKLRSTRLLANHKAQYHSRRYRYICPVCSRDFSINRTVHTHLKKVHNIPSSEHPPIQKQRI